MRLVERTQGRSERLELLEYRVEPSLESATAVVLDVTDDPVDQLRRQGEFVADEQRLDLRVEPSVVPSKEHNSIGVGPLAVIGDAPAVCGLRESLSVVEDDDWT